MDIKGTPAEENRIEIWADLIGRVIIGFGEIEDLLARCTDTLPLPLVKKKVKKASLCESACTSFGQLFKKKSPQKFLTKQQFIEKTLVNRINIIQDLVKQYIPGPEGDEFFSLLGKAKKHAVEDRNLLAHNPLSIEVYQRQDGSHIAVTGIRSLRNHKKIISLDETRIVAKEISLLAGNLFESWMAILANKEALIKINPVAP